MKCPKCDLRLRKVSVKVAGAKNRAVSFQCPECDYFEFEPVSSKRVIEELRESPLKIKQKVVKLSGERLGIYFNNNNNNNNVVRSLDLRKGEEVFVSVPDERHIVVELGGKR